jgi:hypothetical protein
LASAHLIDESAGVVVVVVVVVFLCLRAAVRDVESVFVVAVIASRCDGSYRLKTMTEL